MTKYEVWSGRHYVDLAEGEAETQLEVTRIERNTADADAALIKEITGRKAWVEEVSGG